MSIDDVVKGKLLSKAREAARNSYSPYSLSVSYTHLTLPTIRLV